MLRVFIVDKKFLNLNGGSKKLMKGMWQNYVFICVKSRGDEFLRKATIKYFELTSKRFLKYVTIS